MTMPEAEKPIRLSGHARDQYLFGVALSGKSLLLSVDQRGRRPNSVAWNAGMIFHLTPTGTANITPPSRCGRFSWMSCMKSWSLLFTCIITNRRRWQRGLGAHHAYYL